MSQPVGTVTLLFTDVEGSTRLLERLGAEQYAEVLEQHRRLLREAFTRHEGYEVGTVTDGELTIEFENDVVTLAAGDSITFPCDRPHLIGNRSKTVTAVATWLIVHP